MRHHPRMATPDPLLSALAASTATALLLGAVLVFRRTQGPRRPAAARWLVLASASVAAQALAVLPGAPLGHGAPGLLLKAIGAANVAATWAFAVQLLDDRWRWSAPACLGFAALLASPTVFALADAGVVPGPWVAAWAPRGALPAGLAVAHLAALALRGARDDLVDERRRLRRGLVLAIALGLAVVLVAEHLGGPLGERLRLATAAVLAFGAMAVLAHWPREAWGGVPAVPTAPPAGLAPADALELARLRRVMDEERAFLDPGLDLGQLATRVGVPPHRLRRLINGHLGHRHFADFLNDARLAEVRRRLAEPALARRPILSIALEAGFPSLATFNRVFKAREGMTPTAFRQQALGDALANDPSRSTK